MTGQVPSPGRRIRRNFIILSFSSYEQAMEMEDFCGANAIPGRLIPLPPQVHAGCGLCWRMDPEEIEQWETKPGKTEPEKTEQKETEPEKTEQKETEAEDAEPGKTKLEEPESEDREGTVLAAVDRIRAAGLVFEGPHKVSMWTMEKAGTHSLTVYT